MKTAPAVASAALLALVVAVSAEPEKKLQPIPEWEELSEEFRLIVESPRGVQRDLLHGKHAADLSAPQMIADFLITFESARKKRTRDTDRLLSACVDIMKHKAAPEFAGPLMQIAEARLCNHPTRAKALLSYYSLAKDNDYVMAKLKGDDFMLRAAAQWAVAVSEDQELLAKAIAAVEDEQGGKSKGKDKGTSDSNEIGRSERMMENEDTVQLRAIGMFLSLSPSLEVSESGRLQIKDEQSFQALFSDLRDLFFEHPEYVTDALLGHGVVDPGARAMTQFLLEKLAAEMQAVQARASANE